MINSFDDIVNASQSIVNAIPQVSETTNFWMVRSKKGVFYSEYITQNYIAIGWNVLTESVLSSGHQDDYYKDLLKENSYPDKMPGTALNKCRRFIEELKPGDIAMIIGRDEITFATIGDYFEIKDSTLTASREIEIAAQIDSGTYLGSECPYIKRRHISIIGRVNLDSAPPMVYKCLVSNRHSLSSLNDYADAILCCCYDLVYYNNRLIIKYHIQQPKDINPIDFSMYTYSVASLIADDPRLISGKYNLNSEGDILLFLANHGEDILTFLKEHVISILTIYFILFGGKFAGIEFPSSIDTIKSIVSDFLYRKENKRIRIAEANAAEALVEKTKAETAKLQAETAEIKIRTQKQASKTVDELRQAAGPLNIKSPASNIIDISALFQDNDKPK